MLWAKENLFDCSCLAHLPRIHDCYSIACVCDDAHVMCHHHFHELISYRVHWVKSCCRVLSDVRDLLSPDLLHCGLSKSQQILSFEFHCSADNSSWLWNYPQY